MKRLAEGRFFGSTLSTRRTGGLVLVDSLHRAGSRLPRHRHERAYLERHDTPVRSFNVELGDEWLGLVFDIAGPLDQPAELVNDAVATAGARLFDEFTRDDSDSSGSSPA